MIQTKDKIINNLQFLFMKTALLYLLHKRTQIQCLFIQQCIITSILHFIQGPFSLMSIFFFFTIRNGFSDYLVGIEIIIDG